MIYKDPTAVDIQDMKDEAASLTNAELLEETMAQHHGDDYDGDFTRWGEQKLSVYRDELHRRLRTAGFLPLASVDTARGGR